MSFKTMPLKHILHCIAEFFLSVCAIHIRSLDCPDCAFLYNFLDRLFYLLFRVVGALKILLTFGYIKSQAYILRSSTLYTNPGNNRQHSSVAVGWMTVVSVGLVQQR